MTKNLRITRLRVSNYRGIETLDAEIGGNGAIATGRNAAGKTSLLKAIRAAIDAQDVAPDAIRLGADRAEILVDLDAVSVRRVITSKSSTLTVERDGLKATKPQTYLREILGLSTLDPLDLYLSKPEKRRDQILAALPVTVTVEQLQQWAPVPDDEDVSAHGLEVIARVHKRFYDRRTDANRDAHDARRELVRLQLSAAAAAKASEPFGLTVEVARGQLEAAINAEASLIRGRESAVQARLKNESARARLDAEGIAIEQARAAAVAKHRIDEVDVRAQADDLRTRAAQLRAELAVVNGKLDQKCVELDAIVTANVEAEALLRGANDRAAALASAYATLDTTTIGPSDDLIEQARREVAGAEERLGKAERWMAYTREWEAMTVAANRAADHEQRASALDEIVRRLAAAPAVLLGASSPIAGLRIDDDDVWLDGVRLSERSGQEQVDFAIEIAKRLNGKAKILVCDGLERLDPEQMRSFVKRATEGGWQLIGSRVGPGEIVLEAIELDETVPESGARATV